MSRPPLILLPLLVLLALAAPASAEDDTGPAEVAAAFSRGFDQAVYKGLVGSVLDAIPMDAAQRVDLQRTNAVVSNTLLGRSLTVLAGLSNPVLLLGGFVWGLWAASNIEPAEAGIQLAADRNQSGGGAATREQLAALLAAPAAAIEASATGQSEPVLVSSIAPVQAEQPVAAPARVFKIWLPQRSPAPPQ